MENQVDELIPSEQGQVPDGGATGAHTGAREIAFKVGHEESKRGVRRSRSGEDRIKMYL
jgi:hypothetical protein